MKYEFITQANAQEVAATAADQPNSFMSFIPLILIFVVFYFLIIRPQSKKIKEHQAMVNALKVGDKVVTSGGIIGKVSHIDDKENLITVEIASGVEVKVLRAFVSDLVNKEVKVKEDKKSKK